MKRPMRLVLVAGCLAIGTSAALADNAASVAAGLFHVCALTPAGGVECWGYNDYGQLGDGTTTSRSTPTAVSGLSSGVAAIAPGYYHTCALAVGGVVCWGNNSNGQLGDGTTTQRTSPAAVSGLASGVAAVAAGGYHSCAITSVGGVVCWGRNLYGQLGDGTTTDQLTPTAVSGLASGVAAIAAGGSYTCALTTVGGVVCWGQNNYGQLGDGTTTNRLTPTAVSGLASGVAAIAAGGSHTCALTTGGGAVCWGYNSSGQLGDGTMTNRSTPTAVSGLASGVAAIEPGGTYTCVRTTSGSVLCWGLNHVGQLGDGTVTQRLTPTAVSGMTSGAAAIATGDFHSCAVTEGGTLACWGDNTYGQLGDGTTLHRATAMGVTGLSSGVAAIALGYGHSCALTTGGGVLCWGQNIDGQLGDGTNTGGSAPVAVSGLATGVSAVAGGGGSHNCALNTSGGVVCWGANAYGQLGDGTTTERWVPTAVSGLPSGVAAIALGYGHSCALTTGGGVVCWGHNNYGQLGDGTTTSRSTPTAVSGLGSGVAAIAVGLHHTCARTTSGAIKCWGYNSNGQLGDGTTTNQVTPTAVSGLPSGITAVTAGGYHTCARTTDGGVVCWGYNYHGQLGDGTTTQRLTPTAVSGLSSGATTVVPGGFHTCARTTGGGVVCWGYNYNGQLGDGTTTKRLTPTAVSGMGSGAAAIALGFYHTCARTTGGGVLCWGDDEAAQLGLGTRTYAAIPIGAYGFGGAIAVSAISPATGSAGGGTAVTITGGYFLEGATVAIGGVAATNVTVLNTETITATAGPHAVGRVDVVVTNPDGTQATLANGFLYSGAGVDFTGDLSADILWRHGTQGDLWLWPMDGAAKQSETYVRTVSDMNWEIRGQGDQNGDGTADLLWRNKVSGLIYYWPMSVGAPTAETYVATVDTAYDIVGTGDFNGDGRSDILWRNTAAGDVWIWLMNGATVSSAVYVDAVDPGYLVKGVGDLDGDTKADIVWHGAAGDVWVWLMNGTARLSQNYVGTVPDPNYQIQQVADFDGNGKADLLWWNSAQGDVWMWPMNGAVRVSETWVGTVPDTNYRIVGAGDYNGNFKADILWRNASAGDVWVWLMNGTTKLSENYVGTVPDLGYQIVSR
jgi:alpha-tubulin suppressor-like RCC1 family protein